MQIQLLLEHAYRPPTQAAIRTKPDGTPDCHAVKIVLDRLAIFIFVTGHPIDTETPNSSPTGQTVRSTASIERVADGSLQVHVVSSALSTRLASALRHPASDVVTPMHPHVARDPAIERLARTLVATQDAQDGFGEIYLNAVSVAIITRLIVIQARSASCGTGRPRPRLQYWRLKRVTDHVDAHLEKPITLADLAKVSGLTRMHFARQFRAATGYRPHEYVLRRRIERAQDLLRNSRATLVEVALSVGFQAQAHFTTTFKRFVGETPHRWRTSIPEDSLVLAPSRGIVDTIPLQSSNSQVRQRATASPYLRPSAAPTN